MKVNTKQSNANQLVSSFIPEIIKRAYADNRVFISKNLIKKKHGVLLWIDIADFSALSRQLISDTVNGVEGITSILNNHYNSVLHQIKIYGGEPLFFAGDGLMSAWSGDEGQVQDFVELASACAMSILKSAQTFDNQKQSISLHMVISAGLLEMAVLKVAGGTKVPTFFGDVFNDIKTASGNRKPGQILIYNKALAFLDKSLQRVPVAFNTSILLETPLRSPLPESSRIELRDDVLGMLQSFMPRTIPHPINMARLKWIAEIRPVSSLFVRLVNQSADSTENFQRLKKAVAFVTPLVQKYDGLINQVWIDEKDSQMFICFGPPPSAHTNNQERSVRLGVEINNLLSKAGLENGVGVSSGMAYCGILGNDMLRHYTIIGDAVNLSSRLAGIATSTIVCDEQTYKATAYVVKYKGPVLQIVKGWTDAQRVYMLESVVNAASELKTELVLSRVKELNQLIESFEKTRDGAGMCVIVEAETGMGKTHLLQSFRNQIADRSIILSSSGEYILRNIPYKVVSPIFSDLLGVSEDGRNKRDIIESLVQKYGVNACLLNAVLALNIPESVEVKGMTSVQKVDKTHDLLLRILEDESSKSRIVIIIDDAQWMDATTYRLLQSVNAHLKQCLIVLAYQKENLTIENRNVVFQNTKVVVLAALTEQELRQLIASTLNVSNVSKQVYDLIRTLGKGNTFFSIELAASLRDQNLLNFENDSCFLIKGLVLDDLVLPETLRGAVFSRIDRLNQGSQIALKVGSVIGKQFGTKVAKSIYPILEEKKAVSNYLRQVRQSGFIDDLIVDSMKGYYFTNDTIAQVAYEMTLLEQRRHLHKECASWYEKNYKNNLSPHYVRLAHHWLQARDRIKAAKYHEKEALRLFSLGYALQALEFGLEGLRLLNIEIERDPAVIGQRIGEHLGFIGHFMADKSIDSLRHHKTLEQEEIKLIIKTLLVLCPIAHQCQQSELFALMTIYSFRLTLVNGNGESAAEVYSMYSVIYKAITHDSITALAWSNLAMEIDKQKNYSLIGRTVFIHCWFIALWSNPLRKLIPIAESAFKPAFKMGDVVYGCFNLSLIVVLKSVSGIHLDEIVSTAQEHFIRNNHRILNAAFHLKHEEQVAKAFQGRTTGNTSLSDEKYDEAKDIASICDTDLYNQIGYYYVSKLKLDVHYGNWENALNWADQALVVLPAFASQPGHIELEQYSAMASLYNSAENAEAINEELLGVADASIERVTGWAKICPENFEHKALLLRAIREGLTGDVAAASEMFESTAAKALESGYIQDVGLAFEHLGRMQKRARISYEKAHRLATNAYKQWGAGAKVTYLQTLFQ